jgi:hypothetical protein
MPHRIAVKTPIPEAREVRMLRMRVFDGGVAQALKQTDSALSPYSRA